MARIIIHHHALIYQDTEGVWFPSFIGAWIEEIAIQFEKVAFIAEMTNKKIDNQDFRVCAPNLEIISIGIRGLNSSKEKNKKIVEIGKKYCEKYNHLLIRGITPRQYQVYKAFKKIPCSFLMVGCLIESKPKLKLSYNSILVYLIYFLRLFQLILISKKASIFANSPKIVNEFKSEFGIKALFVPTNTLRNSDLSDFLFRGFTHEPILFYCGRIVKEKGIEELILAIAFLKKRGIICQLHIAGSITVAYNDYLNKLINKEGIVEKVSFLGFKAFGTELLNLYQKADIFVLPSYHEGFPHSIWEACAMCTPIITTKVGGIPGILSSNEVFFIDSKSPKAIAEAVEQITLNVSETELRVEAAYHLLQSYTLEMCVTSLKNNLVYINA